MKEAQEKKFEIKSGLVARLLQILHNGKNFDQPYYFINKTIKDLQSLNEIDKKE